MKKASLIFSTFALTAFALLAVACGAVQQGVQAAKEAMALTQVGQLYKTFNTSKGKPPANADDLISVATTQDEKDAVQQVKDGKFTIIWGIDTKAAGMGGQVLGYSSATINGQRVVLTVDGNVQAYQDSAFQNMPKAKPGAVTGKDKK